MISQILGHNPGVVLACSMRSERFRGTADHSKTSEGSQDVFRRPRVLIASGVARSQAPMPATSDPSVRRRTL